MKNGIQSHSCRCKTCVFICRQSTFTSIYISTHSLTFWQHYNCTADNILYTTFLLFSLFPDGSRDYPKWSMVNERESLLKMEIFSPHFSPELDIVEGHCWKWRGLVWGRVLSCFVNKLGNGKAIWTPILILQVGFWVMSTSVWFDLVLSTYLKISGVFSIIRLESCTKKHISIVFLKWW